VDYGYIKVKLAEIIENQNISINKLAFRSETQRTQIKTYLHGDIQRVDLSVLARLCYALECDLSDILEYVPPQGIKS
jgi:putative transcriptional regulator